MCGRTLGVVCAALIGSALGVSDATAATLVVNGGFENPGTTTTINGFTSGTPGVFPGWNFTYNGTATSPCGSGQSTHPFACSYITSNPTYVHSGTYGAVFGPIGTTSAIEQDIATTPGQTYQVSFWLDNEPGPGGPGTGTTNSALVTFGSTTLLTLSDAASFGFTEVTGNVTAASTSTALTFTFQNDPAGYGLDDVSVSATPLPAALPLFATGLGALGLLGWRRKRKGRAF